MRKIVWQLATGVGILLALGIQARGQWEVVYLHPEGADSSQARGAAGARQGGLVEPPDTLGYRPVIWNRSPHDYVDLLPDGCRTGILYAMDGP